MRTIIANGTIVTVDAADTVLEPGWIVIQDGSIVTVGRERVDTSGADEVLDASGRVVLPGFVNTHTHLNQTLIRGVLHQITFDEWLTAIYHAGRLFTAADVLVAAQVGCLEAQRSGVTTLVDHSFLDRGIELSEPTVRGMLTSGIRAGFARVIIDVDWFAPPEATETPESGLRNVERLMTVYRREVGPMLQFLTGGNTPGASASGEMAKAATAFAAEHGLRQSMHVASNAGVIRSLQHHYGRDGVIAWLEEIGALGPGIIAAHSVLVSKDEIAIMARRGISVAHAPLSNMFLGDGVCPMADMLEAGVNVTLASDGAASNNSQDLFEVLKVATLQQRARTRDPKVVPVTQALRMATINGAKALGIDHLTGSIEVGKRADLMILDLGTAPHNTAVHDVVAHLVYSAKSTDVRHVLVDGVVRLRDRVPTWIDEGELLATANRAGRAVVGRLAA